MEKQAKLGLGIASIFALLISLVLYLAPGILPSSLGGNPTSEEAVHAFQTEGLEVGTYYDVEDEEKFGLRGIQPRTYIEGTRFTIPSLERESPEPSGPLELPEPPTSPEITDPNGNVTKLQLPEPEVLEMPGIPQADQGGRVFTFEDQQDLAVLKDYYESLGKSGGMFYSHVFTEGNVLLQMNGELPKDKAEKYEAVLKRVAG